MNDLMSCCGQTTTSTYGEIIATRSKIRYRIDTRSNTTAGHGRWWLDEKLEKLVVRADAGPSVLPRRQTFVQTSGVSSVDRLDTTRPWLECRPGAGPHVANKGLIVHGWYATARQGAENFLEALIAFHR